MLSKGLFNPTLEHFAIVANGNFLVREILLEIIKDKKVIALDGASNKLATLKIKPSVILGDFDSIKPESLWGVETLISINNPNQQPIKNDKGITVVHTVDQDLTDLVKAIRYCKSSGAASIHILCATGGRLDHHEGAMRCLRSEYVKDCMIYLHSEQQTLRFSKDESITIRGEKDDKCGVLAFPAATCTSKGLRYNMVDMKLELGFSESICNSLYEQNATVEIKGEALLIMPPFFQSQRDFSHKSDVERLELQLRDAKGEIAEEKVLNHTV